MVNKHEMLSKVKVSKQLRLIRKLLVFSITFFILSTFCTKTAKATTYYISPGGNDNNSGTSQSQTWATFVRAFKDLFPGDTLILLDGVYKQTISPTVRNGQPGAPITLKALNDGRAIIDGEFVRTPVDISNHLINSYFTIEGIVAKNSNEVVYRVGAGSGTGNVLRRVSGYNANTDENYHVFSIYSDNALLEDCIAAGTGRKMAFGYGSQNVTIRRCVASAQEYLERIRCAEWPWQEGFEMYNSSNGIIENSISLGGNMAFRAFSNLGNIDSSTGNNPYASNNRYLGDIAVKGSVHDDGSFYRWGVTRPKPTTCTGPITQWWQWPAFRSGFSISANGVNAVVRDAVYKDIFSWGNAGVGFIGYGSGSLQNVLVENATILNNGLDFRNSPGIGTELKLDLDAGAFNFVNTYIEGSQYQGSGAQLQYRYQDGVLTNQALWPWPMEERVLRELGSDVTGTITEILQSNGVPTGASLLPPLINPTPPLANIPDGYVGGATYTKPVTISIVNHSQNPSATIRYTTNGSEPDANSPQYSGPFTVSSPTIVKARAFSGSQSSHSRSAYYNVDQGKQNAPPEVEAHGSPFIYPPEKQYWPYANSYMQIAWPTKQVDLYGIVSDMTYGTNPNLTTSWSKAGGPGTVTFGNASRPRTTAQFSAPGRYMLRLTANDGQLSSSADVDINVIDHSSYVHTIPGRIDAEDYKSGGEGVGYFDTTNSGFFSGSEASYRGDQVDMVYAYNEFWGHSVNRVSETEWLAYNVDVTAPGSYKVTARVGSDNDGGIFHLELDGVDITGPLTGVRVGPGSRSYTDLVAQTPPLSTGRYELRMIADSASPQFSGQTSPDKRELGVYINYFDFSPTSGSNLTATPTNTSTPTATPKPGDANGDNKVDGVDYVVWLNNYNTQTINGHTDGDFNIDKGVDGIDYVVWLNNYGT